MEKGSRGRGGGWWQRRARPAPSRAEPCHAVPCRAVHARGRGGGGGRATALWLLGGGRGGLGLRAPSPPPSRLGIKRTLFPFPPYAGGARRRRLLPGRLMRACCTAGVTSRHVAAPLGLRDVLVFLAATSCGVRRRYIMCAASARRVIIRHRRRVEARRRLHVALGRGGPRQPCVSKNERRQPSRIQARTCRDPSTSAAQREPPFQNPGARMQKKKKRRREKKKGGGTPCKCSRFPLPRTEGKGRAKSTDGVLSRPLRPGRRRAGGQSRVCCGHTTTHPPRRRRLRESGRA